MYVDKGSLSIGLYVGIAIFMIVLSMAMVACRLKVRRGYIFRYGGGMATGTMAAASNRPTIATTSNTTVGYNAAGIKLCGLILLLFFYVFFFLLRKEICPKHSTQTIFGIHVFFYKHVFGRPGSDMISQNLERDSNYASDMLILVYLRAYL